MFQANQLTTNPGYSIVNVNAELRAWDYIAYVASCARAESSPYSIDTPAKFQKLRFFSRPQLKHKINVNTSNLRTKAPRWKFPWKKSKFIEVTQIRQKPVFENTNRDAGFISINLQKDACPSGVLRCCQWWSWFGKIPSRLLRLLCRVALRLISPQNYNFKLICPFPLGLRKTQIFITIIIEKSHFCHVFFHCPTD